MIETLNARILGDGPETLVLSHGFGCDQSSWQYLLPELASRYRVLVYDLACAGSVALEFFDVRRHGVLDGYVDDLIEILDTFDIRRCTFIGHSVSGMIGILAAIRIPQRFNKLIALGSSARYLDDGNYRGGFSRPVLQQIFDAIELNYRDWAKNFAPFALTTEVDDPVTTEFTRTLLSMRPDIALASARAIFLGDWRDRIEQCATPTVLLQSRHDPAVPQAAADYLHRHLQESTLEVLDTTGHLPHLSVPKTVSQALSRHLPVAA